MESFLRERTPTLVYAVGGQAAAAAPPAVPLVGSDRFATARVLAETIFDRPTFVGVASGINFPDGLSGGVHAGRLGGPLLLALPEALPASTVSFLTRTPTVTSAFVYGGTAAVGYAATRDLGVPRR